MDSGYVTVFLITLALTVGLRWGTEKSISHITVITAVSTTVIVNTFEYFVYGIGVPAIGGSLLIMGYVALFFSIGICAVIRLIEIVRERMSKAKP